MAPAESDDVSLNAEGQPEILGISLMDKVRKACRNKQLCPYDLRVRIIQEGKTFLMHKDLFVMASPIFDSVLRINMTAVEGKYNVNVDIESKVFSEIRTFLYNDTLPRNLSFNLALKVLETSLQYDIDRLLSHTKAFVERNMTPENALKVLQTARSLEFTKLEDLALELILQNAQELLKSDEFITLGCWDVCRILSSDALRCREVDVFNAAYRWAEEKSKYSKYSKQSLKYYFSQVATCIRFPLMAPAELASLTLKKDILEQEDLLNLFQFICVPEPLKASVPVKFNTQPRAYSGCNVITTCNFVSTGTQTCEREHSVTKGGMLPPTIANSNPRKRNISGAESAISSAAATTPSKVKRVDFEQGSDSKDDYFYVSPIQYKFDNREAETFEEIMRRCFKLKQEEAVGGFDFSNAVIQSNYRNALFQNCKDFRIDAQCKFFDKENPSFFNFIKHFDPMRYIQFKPNSKIEMSVENIWTLNQDILLKFNRVTFLRVFHAKESGNDEKNDILVMNYIPDSKRILNSSKFRQAELALSNCEFSTKQLRERGRQIEKLTLYRVWGDYKLEEIMKDCPNLKELMCWKHVPTSWEKGSNFSAPLYLNFSNTFAAKSNIQKLSLFKVELRFPVRCSNVATSVTELFLDDCNCEHGERTAHISEVFDQVFPKLQKLVIWGNLATPSLINCVLTKIGSIQKLVIENMKWIENDIDIEGANETLLSFLEQNTEIRGTPETFTLEKSCENNKWVGTDKSEKARESTLVDGGYWTNKDEMEYNLFNLHYFYDSCEAFEDYFYIGDKFPKPILWI